MVHQRSLWLWCGGLRVDDALRERPFGRVVPAIAGMTNAASQRGEGI